MDSIKIYSASGALLVDAILEDSSTQDWGIMSENQVTLEFYTDECVILPASCYIEFDGQRFWLLEEYKPTENNSAEWAYQVRFLGAESLLSVTVVLNTTDNLDEPIFNLTAPASQHLDFIVKNLNRRFPGMNWRVGVVPETENIHIEYVGTYASDALQTIVGEKYEWWVDDYVVNVGRCEFGTAIELGYGKGLIGGITYSTANEMRSYAYLYPIGSTRNIDPAKYGHARLQLPNGQTRIDINPEQGLSELVEADAFASIFPKYVGKVTSVRTSTGKNSDGTTFLIYHIKDTAIPFNPNDYEIAGEVKHITFQSGELMGADFEVNYDANNKEFEIITQFLDEGLSQLPGGTLIPKTGDKYVVWNISMPDEYYPLAEQEFLQSALSFVQDSIKETSVYRASVDFIDLQERGLTLRPGQKVRLLSDEYFPQNGYYDSRITRIIRDICYPDELIIEVSTVVTQGTISRLRTSVSDSATKVASLGQSLKNYVDVMSPQSVRGVKNFVNGLSIGGVGLWRHPDGYVYLDETLVLKGGVVMYANGSGVSVPSIFDSLPIDGETIKRDGNGALYVDETALKINGGGGGVADSVHWNNVTGKPSWIGPTKPSYKYSEIEERPDLSVYAKLSDIPSLNGYATQSWVENKGYLLATTASNTYQPKITSSNKLAYSLISGTPDLSVYFLASNFTKANIKSTLGISDWALASAKPTYKYSEISNTPDLSVYALNTDLAKKWTQNDAKIANWDSAYSWGNHANAGYAKASDVTNEFKNYVKLAGDSQSITAQHNFTNGLKIGGVSLRKVDNHLYLDSSLVLSGGVTMYGDDGTTVKPIWESIPFDRTTIDWVDGKWTVVGGVGSGGISEEFLNVTLQGYQPKITSSNKLAYSLISGTPDLSGYAKLTDIPSLSDYATQSWVEGYSAKWERYIDITNNSTFKSIGYGTTAYGWPYNGPAMAFGANASYNHQIQSPADKNTLYHRAINNGVAKDWVMLLDSGNYADYALSLTGGTMSGSITTRTNTYSYSSAKTVGHIIAGHTSGDNFAPIISTSLVSGGYGKVGQVRDQFGLYAYSAADTSPKTRVELLPEKTTIQITGHTIPATTSSYTLGDSTHKWSNVYATSFIGDLTGTASGNLMIKAPADTLPSLVNIAGYGYESKGWETTGPAITFGGSTYKAGFQSTYSSGALYFGFAKTSDADLSDWKRIAFTDSNVASATKLATARTIWGQSFDGTGDITGDAIINGDLTIPNNNSIKVKSSAGVVYSVLKMSTANSLSIGQESASNGRTTMIYGNLIRLRCGTGGTDALYVNADGNVTIGASNLAGTTTKMYVDGTAKFTGDTTFSSKVVIGTIPVYESVDGTLYVDANIVFRGGVAMHGNTTTTVNEE